jgi:uncharacterized protein (UPF0548 family)
MFFVSKPSEAAIRAILAERAEAPLSYEIAGCTRCEPASFSGWNLDRHRVLLGHGEESFHRARKAIENWAMFPREIAEACYPDTPIRACQVVGVLYWAAPVMLWLLCPARIVYSIDAIEKIAGHHLEQFGFAYGTLPGHPERGEERFLVEWNRADNTVWYDLLAISQPAHWLVRLGYPYARYEQARFRRLSAAAMRAAVLHKTLAGSKPAPGAAGNPAPSP